MKTYTQHSFIGIRKNDLVLDPRRPHPNVLQNNSQRITVHGITVHTITIPLHLTSKTKFLIKYFPTFII